MELKLYEMIYLILFGFFVGIIGSIMGIGGGAFIVPFLVIVFGLSIKKAIAVSLVSIIATSNAVASVNVEKGLANIRVGIILELTMALGSIFATFIMISINPSVLQVLFSFMLLPTALSMYIKSRKKIEDELVLNSKSNKEYCYYDYSLKRVVRYSVIKEKLAMFFSFFAGMLSGLFGLGGGLIQVPVMNLICKIPMKVATSTSNFMIGLSSCASALILWKKGYIIPNISFFMVIGVLFGSFLGMKILYRAKNSNIQLAFSILLMITSVKMIYEVFK